MFATGNKLTLHQQDDLVIILHTADFLRNGDQRQIGVVALQVFKDPLFGVVVYPGCKVIQQ